MTLSMREGWLMVTAVVLMLSERWIPGQSLAVMNLEMKCEKKVLVAGMEAQI